MLFSKGNILCDKRKVFSLGSLFMFGFSTCLILARYQTLRTVKRWKLNAFIQVLCKSKFQVLALYLFTFSASLTFYCTSVKRLKLFRFFTQLHLSLICQFVCQPDYARSLEPIYIFLEGWAMTQGWTDSNSQHIRINRRTQVVFFPPTFFKLWRDRTLALVEACPPWATV